MKKVFPLIIALFIVALLVYTLSLDFATPVIPGWHTTIFPPYFIVSVLLIFLLLIDLLLYWIALYKKSSDGKKIILWHFIISIIFTVLITHPSILFSLETEVEQLSFTDKLINLVISYIVFQVAYLLCIAIVLLKKRVIE